MRCSPLASRGQKSLVLHLSLNLFSHIWKLKTVKWDKINAKLLSYQTNKLLTLTFDTALPRSAACFLLLIKLSNLSSCLIAPKVPVYSFLLLNFPYCCTVSRGCGYQTKPMECHGNICSFPRFFNIFLNRKEIRRSRHEGFQIWLREEGN